MSEKNKNPENNQDIENEVSEVSTWYDKYFPHWYKSMNIKSKFISLFIILILAVSIGYTAYYYAKMFIMENIPEISAIFIFALVAYLLPKTDLWKRFMQWLIVKYKNLKILGIMGLLSLLVFLIDFKSLILDFMPYIGEKVTGNFIDVTFVYIMVWLYSHLFSQHVWMKYAKHIVLIILLVLFRALFQHTISAGAEQLLNGIVLFLMLLMLGTYIYESIFIRNKKEKKRVGFILNIVFFTTLVFSPYLTSIWIAKKRMDTILATDSFVEIHKLPDTKYDVPVGDKLANIWIDQKNAQNSASTIPDPILYNGSFVFIADSYSTNFWDYYVPFMQKPTQSVKILSTDNWNMKIKTAYNHAIYSDGLMYGHHAHAAVSKKFNIFEYISDMSENTIKFIGKNDSFYTVDLISTLSSFLTPYSVPKNIYVIKDSEEGYNFLFGAGEKVELKDATAKYSFLDKQQIIPLNVVEEVVKSSQLLTGIWDKATNKNLLIADEDKFDNIIIERLYTSIEGNEGVYAHIQFIAKTRGGSRIVNGKKSKNKSKGVDVLQSWFIPLFYTGDDEFNVYYFDNKDKDYTYPAMSKIDSSLLGGVFSTGYEVFGKTSVIRNGNYYVLASRVKLNDGVYSMTPNFVLYSFKTNKQYEVEKPQEMEEIIKMELSH